MIKIVLTGPESTGKTILSKQLSDHFNGCYIPEYARNYVMELKRPYHYQDLEHIAQWQIQASAEAQNKDCLLVFIDTFLIITKIWFLWKYNKYPTWIDDELNGMANTMFLLCNTDIAWQADGVRENGGENREILFRLYENELINYQLPYHIISGEGNDRLDAAIKIVSTIIDNHK